MGTLRVNSILATVLLDSRASHTFMSKLFAQEHGINFEPMSTPLTIHSPGSSWFTTMVSHGNEIDIAYQKFPTSFIALKSTDIDVILGMDWLTKYQAVIDCALRTVFVTSPAGITDNYWTDCSKSPSAVLKPFSELYAM